MKNIIKSRLLSAQKNIKHAFLGGSWALPRDNEEHKQEKLRDLSLELKIKPHALVVLKQVHSSRVVIVDKVFGEEIPEADALITTKPGLYLGILSADCVPILLAAGDGSMIAAIHAGWRGARAGIIAKTINKMRELGSSEIRAALGPCIWQESYEVSHEFFEEFLNESENNKSYFIKSSKPGTFKFDLPGYVLNKLHESGLKDAEASLLNTYTSEEFYSFRRVRHCPELTLKSNISLVAIVE